MDQGNIKNIPESPGIYLFKNKTDKILYVGKAKNLNKRVQQYFSPGSVRKQDMLSKAHKIDFVQTSSESEALYLEENLIKKNQPEYNRLLKNNTNYVYIKITNEDFGNIFITRHKKNDRATYVGPKHNNQQLKKLLQYMRYIYKFRGCKIGLFKKREVCSDYHFGLCAGRCIMDSSQKENYKKITKELRSFFGGKTKPIEKEIEKKIKIAIEKQNFERAAQLRDILRNIQGFTERQTVVLEKSISGSIANIQQAGKFYIITILKFTEGKLIDIIKHKQEEKDLSTIVAEIKNEFKTEIHEEWEKYKHIYHSLNKKINKKEKEEIELLFENVYESMLIVDTEKENTIINELLQNIQEKYQTKNFPYRVECIDISHMSGGRTSGGLSCITGGIPNKKGYRRYKISSSVNKSDDYEALKEVFCRRFKITTKTKEFDKEKIQAPDLFILDGGKGQLHILEELEKTYPIIKKITQEIDIVALGKGEARNTSKIGSASKKTPEEISETIYKYQDGKMTATKLSYDQADKLLVKLRNEAHRFANAYRKKQMSMERR